jgi:hypothetical protein
VLLTEHHDKKTYWKSGGIAPLILILGTRWRWVVSFTPRPLHPQEKRPWYPLDRRPGGSQSRSESGGEEKNSQPLPGLEPHNLPARSPPLYHWATCEKQFNRIFKIISLCGLLLKWLYSSMRTFVSLMDFSQSSQSIWQFRDHILGFLTVDFSGVGSTAPRPTPNLEDQVSIFISPGDWVAHLYPQAPSSHFSRLLWHTWATVGLFFSPVTTRGRSVVYLHVLPSIARRLFFIAQDAVMCVALWWLGNCFMHKAISARKHGGK